MDDIVLETARALYSQRGAALSLSEVASSAGVSRATLYDDQSGFGSAICGRWLNIGIDAGFSGWAISAANTRQPCFW